MRACLCAWWPRSVIVFFVSATAFGGRAAGCALRARAPAVDGGWVMWLGGGLNDQLRGAMHRQRTCGGEPRQLEAQYGYAAGCCERTRSRKPVSCPPVCIRFLGVQAQPLSFHLMGAADLSVQVPMHLVDQYCQPSEVCTRVPWYVLEYRYVRMYTCTCVPGCCFYCMNKCFTHCICQFLSRTILEEQSTRPPAAQ